MVHAYSKIFGTLKPVFDGRNNLYTRDPLPIGNDRLELEVTLPGEGKDRVFRVTIKWVAQVSSNLHNHISKWCFILCIVTGISLCFGRSIGGSHSADTFRCHSCLGCGDASFTIHDIYSSRTEFFLISWWLLPSSRRRARGLVWFPSIGQTESMEDDAKHWRWIFV